MLSEWLIGGAIVLAVIAFLSVVGIALDMVREAILLCSEDDEELRDAE